MAELVMEARLFGDMEIILPVEIDPAETWGIYNTSFENKTVKDCYGNVLIVLGPKSFCKIKKVRKRIRRIGNG